MSEKPLTPLDIGLTPRCAIEAMSPDTPLTAAKRSPGFHSALSTVSHRTFEIGLRAWW